MQQQHEQAQSEHTKPEPVEEPKLNLNMEVNVMPPPRFFSSLKRGKEEEGEKILKTDKRVGRSRAETALCEVSVRPDFASKSGKS